MKRALTIMLTLTITLMNLSSVAMASSPTASDYLLVPGKSCGRIAIGMTKQRVIALLGKPTKVIGLGPDEDDSYYWTTPPMERLFYRSKKSSACLNIGLNKGVVECIEFTAHSFKTADGLGIGGLDIQKCKKRFNLFKCFDNVKYQLKTGGLTFYGDRVLSGGTYQYPPSESGVIHKGMNPPIDNWPDINEQHPWSTWDGVEL